MDRAIVALLQHSTIERAAESIGVSDVTLWRWKQKQDFQDRLRQAQREAFSESLARLQQAASAAVATLVKTMVDSNAPVPSRVRAADCILKHAAQGIKLQDLETRVSELERGES